MNNFLNFVNLFVYGKRNFNGTSSINALPVLIKVLAKNKTI